MVDKSTGSGMDSGTEEVAEAPEGAVSLVGAVVAVGVVLLAVAVLEVLFDRDVEAE